MGRKNYYYRFEEAEELRQTFSSWINKTACIGNGEANVLKRIIVKQKRSAKGPNEQDRVYSVNFEFVNARKVDAYNFLINNGLRIVADDLIAGKNN